jgi:hypothetical protein
VTGSRGSRGFRILPYRVLRRECGLESLYHGRNVRPLRAA